MKRLITFFLVFLLCFFMLEASFAEEVDMPEEEIVINEDILYDHVEIIFKNATATTHEVWGKKAFYDTNTQTFIYGPEFYKFTEAHWMRNGSCHYCGYTP